MTNTRFRISSLKPSAKACLAGIGLFLAACEEPSVSTTKKASGAEYDRGLQFSSDLSPTDAAKAFRAKGFKSVSVINGGKTVRVRSNSTSLVNCGTVAQFARGKRSTFPGNAPTAATLSDDRPNDVQMRTMKTASVLTMTHSKPGTYVLQERHNLELQKRWVSQSKGRTKRAIVGAVGSAQLDEKTTCRSAQIAQKLL